MDHPSPVPPASGPPGPKATPNALFPVFLKLEQLKVLIVGGDEAAIQILSTILRNTPAAHVTVVAPLVLPALQELATHHPGVELRPRPFQEADVTGHDIVFAATNTPAHNLEIKATANRHGVLTHVAGNPAESDFTPSAVLYKCNLTIAISSNGKSPDVAKGLLEILAETLADEPEQALQQISGLRVRLKDEADQRANSNRVTPPKRLGSPAYESAATAYWRRVATTSLVAFAGFILLNILSYYVSWPQALQVLRTSTTFYTFVAVGFVAQLVDGLLGMGYGVVSAISLMSLGLHPASVSASIHTAEMFASGASGYHHYRFGNVNKKLFKVLLLPGIAGAVSGAYLLSRFGEQYAAWVKPLLATYLLILGLRILSRAFGKPDKRRKVKHAGWLAGAGGFLDSFGGGGWGPLVTSTLIANGRTPQYVIGTVSITEFFVTFSSAFTFFAMLGISHWQIILGLIAGGVAAAPLAARLAGRIPTRWMFVGVGLMVIVWSLWALRKVFL